MMTSGRRESDWPFKACSAAGPLHRRGFDAAAELMAPRLTSASNLAALVVGKLAAAESDLRGEGSHQVADCFARELSRFALLQADIEAELIEAKPRRRLPAAIRRLVSQVVSTRQKGKADGPDEMA